MSYATETEVKSLFRDFADNAEAAVTTAEITIFLDNTSEVIDAKIGTLYSLPITGPKSLKILKQINMFMAAGIVDDILNNYAEADKKPTWDKKAMALLLALVPATGKDGKQPEPTMKLSDSEYLGTSTQKGKISVQSTSEPIFKKGSDNW